MADRKTFKPEEYEKMLVNVNELSPTTDILEATLLGEYQEFTAEMQEYGRYKQEILRYMCLVYDPKSPYVKHYDNLIERKLDVAIDVGFRPGKKGKFPTYVEQMIRCQNQVFNAMIIKYCRLVSGGERNWGALVAANEFYWGQLYKLLKTEPGKDDDVIRDADIKSKIFTAMSKQEKVIQHYEEQFLAGDTHPQLKEDVWIVAENRKGSKRRLSPEAVAKSKEDG